MAKLLCLEYGDRSPSFTSHIYYTIFNIELITVSQLCVKIQTIDSNAHIGHKINKELSLEGRFKQIELS